MNIDNISIPVRSSTYRQNPSNAPNVVTSSQQNFSSNVSPSVTRGKNIPLSVSRKSTIGNVSSSNPRSTNNNNYDDDQQQQQQNCSNLVSTEPEVLLILPPDSDGRHKRSDYLARPVVETEISNVPRLSETGTNPRKNYDLQTSGMYHAEGGWPRDCDASDPEHRLRHLRRTRKEASFLATVKELAARSIPVLRSNNSLDIYHSLFSDIFIDDRLGDGIHGTPNLDFLKLKYCGICLTGDLSNANKNSGSGNPTGAGDDIENANGKNISKQNGNNDNNVNELMAAILSPESNNLFGGDDENNRDNEDDDDEANTNQVGDDNQDASNNTESDLLLDLLLDDESNNNNNQQPTSRKSKLQRMKREKELAVRRAQQHAEDLQIASLASRHVGINSTGVFRDAPRAFPADLLGSDVRDLVRNEQKKIQEQKNIQSSQEALQLATKAMLRRQQEDEEEDYDDDEGEAGIIPTVTVSKSNSFKKEKNNGNDNDNDDDEEDDDNDEILGSTRKMPNSINNNNNNNKNSNRNVLVSTEESSNVPSSLFPSSNNNVDANDVKSQKKVILGPSKSFNEPKVVSSLSWVNGLEIPRGNGSNNSSNGNNHPAPSSSSSYSTNLGSGGSASSTTLAIALASVQNTPHLALLGSTSKNELLRASALFMAQFGDNNNNNTASSSSKSGNNIFNKSSQHQNDGNSTRKTTTSVKSGASSNSNNVTMCGVDVFPTSLIYDAAAPQAPLMRLKTASDLIQLEFSPRDAPLLASGSSDGTISLFDLRKGPTRCLIVADVCNSAAVNLSAAAASSSSSSSAMHHHHQQQQNIHNQLSSNIRGGGTGIGGKGADGTHHHHNNHHPRSAGGGGSAYNSSFRRDPLNPVCALRWVPSSTGGRCTEFVTADLSPYVRIWDTRFVSRGCLDVFNLNSGTVRAAVHELDEKIAEKKRKRDGHSSFSSSSSNNNNSNNNRGNNADGLNDSDEDQDEDDFDRSEKKNKNEHKNSRLHNDAIYNSAMLKAISIDVQPASGRVYIGTTDGKVFAFNRKGRTDSDRLVGVFQVVPKDLARYATSTALNLHKQNAMFASSSSASTSILTRGSPGHNINNNNNATAVPNFSIDVYVHIATHPMLPKCFAAATEWGVSVFADDLPDPVATLPPSPHGVPTSIRWVPHCAALLCVSRISGVVEMWDVCVMLTSPVLLNNISLSFGGGDNTSDGEFTMQHHRSDTSVEGQQKMVLGGGSQPKAIATIMEYSGPSGFFNSSSSSRHNLQGNNNNYVPKVVQEYNSGTTTTMVKSKSSGPPISSLRFSPDGSSLVAGLLDGSTTLLDVTIQDDENVVSAAEDIQLSPLLGGSGGHAVASSSSQSVVPQILGARALELACFSRIMEKRGVHRTKRLLQLQQQNAPDVTTSSTLHYSSSSSSSVTTTGQTKNADGSSSVRGLLQQQFDVPSMTHEKLTLDMAKLSHQYQTTLLATIDHNTSTTVSSSSNNNNTQTTTTMPEQKRESNNKNIPPPFKSSDSSVCSIMDRVANLLYNPSMNEANNNEKATFKSSNANDNDDDNNQQPSTKSAVSSSNKLLLLQQQNRNRGGPLPLSAPLAEDDISLLHLARAIETGVAVAPGTSCGDETDGSQYLQTHIPSKNIFTGTTTTSTGLPLSRGAKRWSTVRRHLMPRTKSSEERELDQYRIPPSSSNLAKYNTNFYSSPSSTAVVVGGYSENNQQQQQPSGVFVPADEQVAKFEKKQEQENLTQNKNAGRKTSFATTQDDDDNDGEGDVVPLVPIKVVSSILSPLMPGSILKRESATTTSSSNNNTVAGNNVAPRRPRSAAFKLDGDEENSQ